MLRLRWESDSRFCHCRGVGQRTYLSRTLSANGGPYLSAWRARVPWWRRCLLVRGSLPARVDGETLWPLLSFVGTLASGKGDVAACSPEILREEMGRDAR